MNFSCIYLFMHKLATKACAKPGPKTENTLKFKIFKNTFRKDKSKRNKYIIHYYYYLFYASKYKEE